MSRKNKHLYKGEKFQNNINMEKQSKKSFSDEGKTDIPIKELLNNLVKDFREEGKFGPRIREEHFNSMIQLDQSIKNYYGNYIDQKNVTIKMFKNTKNINKRIKLIEFDIKQDLQMLRIRQKKKDEFWRSISPSKSQW